MTTLEVRDMLRADPQFNAVAAVLGTTSDKERIYWTALVKAYWQGAVNALAQTQQVVKVARQ